MVLARKGDYSGGGGAGRSLASPLTQNPNAQVVSGPEVLNKVSESESEVKVLK